MRHVLAFLCTLRLLLPLVTCSQPSIWRHSNEVVHLYTADQYRSFHLQIQMDGRVDGTPFQTVYSAVIRKAIPGGYINIIGTKTRYFLCMQSNGNLFGTIYFTYDNCVYKSIWLENNYEVYESVKHKLLVSLGSDKGPFGPDRSLPSFSQFLPRINEIPLSQLS